MALSPNVMNKNSISNLRRVYWVDLNRFDLKPDKSTFIEVSEALIQHGYDTSILTGYGKSAYKPVGYRVKVFNFRTVDISGLFRISLLLRILVWLIKHANPQDIIILSPGGLIIAPILKLFNKKNLHLDVRTPPLNINTWKDHIDQWLFWKIPMHFLKKTVKGYSFITERMKNSLEQEFNNKFNDYVIWQSGVNTDRFKPIYKESREQFFLLYHGTIEIERGLGEVIKAMAMLGEKFQKYIRLVIVGDGRGFSKLIDLASSERVADHVIFKGFVPYEEIPFTIYTADCFICPLPDRLEWNVSSPIKIFEYLACEKPIILTPISAHKDIFNDQKFLVWTKGYKAEHFQEAIEYVYDNYLTLLEASKGASTFVKNNYEWKIQGKKLADYLSHKF
jgi:glycosyltransferase involved in cell wall biosynthesis